MLVEPSPKARSKIPERTGVSVERTAQVAGLQATLLPILTAPLLLVVEPTGPIGELGLGAGPRGRRRRWSRSASR